MPNLKNQLLQPDLKIQIQNNFLNLCVRVVILGILIIFIRMLTILKSFPLGKNTFL